MTHNWKQFFPYPTTRAEQEQAIEFALDAFINDDKKSSWVYVRYC